MKYRYINAAFSLAAMAILSTSCVISLNKKALTEEISKFNKIVVPSGIIAEKDTTVADFQELSLSGPLEVTYIQSDDQFSVKVSCSDNILPYVVISQEPQSSKLSVSVKEGIVHSDGIKVTVRSSSLDNLSASGAVDFISSLVTSEGDLNVSLKGSSDVTIKSVVSKSMSLVVAGSADLELEKIVTGDFKLAIAGSGSADIDKFKGDNVELSIAGSGDVDMYLEAQSLKGNIAGSGTLELSGILYGQAEYSIAGSGDVKAKELKCPKTSYKTRGGSIIYQDGNGQIIRED
ncbi:MAG: GIN domain-containing protein [Candidatus Cryptobacteroides sp.]